MIKRFLLTLEGCDALHKFMVANYHCLRADDLSEDNEYVLDLDFSVSSIRQSNR
jgi:hypothetical protein